MFILVRSNSQLLEVGFFTGVLACGEVLWIRPFHFAQGVVHIDALVEEVGYIPALSILQEKLSSVVVCALKHHPLVRITSKFLINLVVGEVKLNRFELDKMIFRQVPQKHMPAWFILFVTLYIPSFLQIYSYSDISVDLIKYTNYYHFRYYFYILYSSIKLIIKKYFHFCTVKKFGMIVKNIENLFDFFYAKFLQFIGFSIVAII